MMVSDVAIIRQENVLEICLFIAEIAIKDLAKIIKKIVGFKGGINWDKSIPNGTPRKLLDSTKFKNLGWKQKISLENGIDFTYKWYVDNLS